jgi:hypothetical protein
MRRHVMDFDSRLRPTMAHKDLKGASVLHMQALSSAGSRYTIITGNFKAGQSLDPIGSFPGRICSGQTGVAVA